MVKCNVMSPSTVAAAIQKMVKVAWFATGKCLFASYNLHVVQLGTYILHVNTTSGTTTTLPHHERS